ncbi:hypothetical protein OXX79_000395 [Metschnikowia pulcherrima]
MDANSHKTEILIRAEAALREPVSYSTEAACHEVLQFAKAQKCEDTALIWKVKSRVIPLTPAEIICWEAAIEREFSAESAISEKRSMYETIATQYPTVEYISKSLDFGEITTKKLQNAYLKCKDDFMNGQVIFDRLVSSLVSEENWLAAHMLYEARLQIPHVQLNDTYSEFSKFVSEHFQNEYTQIMRQASKVLRSTERSQRYYEMLEQKIASDPDSPQPWEDYITQVHKYADKRQPNYSVFSVFYRSLFAGSRCKVGEQSWRDLWLMAIDLVRESSNIPRSESVNLSRLFAHSYPDDIRAYAERASIATSFAEVREVNFRFISSKHFSRMDHETVSVIKLLIMRMYHLHASNQASSDTFLDELRFTGYERCTNMEVAQFCLRILESFDTPAATHDIMNILQRLVSDMPLRADALTTAIDVYERRGLKRQANDIIAEIESHIWLVDHPWAIFSRIDTYLRWNSSPKDHDIVTARLNKMSRKIREFERTENDQKIDGETNNLTPTVRKRKAAQHQEETESPERKKVALEHTKTAAEPVRSREQFRVKLWPLAPEVTNDDIQHFLAGYAAPLSITITEISDKIADRFAVIECSSEQEVLSCLTRQYKDLSGVPVNIARIFGNTVWATNYPSGYNSNDIKSMILELSGIRPIAIRLPSQREDKERRFFYADFADDTSAALVREKLNGQVIDGHELQAEISNPTLKKSRDVAQPARQIHLHNLNFKKTTEETLRQYFLRCGDVAGIHIPLSDANKEKGFINNGFAFITFATEAAASEALAVGKAEIDDRQIDISAVKPKRQTDKPVTDFNDQRTITVHNVHETVSETQLRKYLDDKVGPVTKVTLKPSRRMALVEFQTVKDAGNAGFSLEGVTFEDLVLRIGPKKDFFQEEKTVKVPGMVPPMLMRRKRK